MVTVVTMNNDDGDNSDDGGGGKGGGRPMMTSTSEGKLKGGPVTSFRRGRENFKTRPPIKRRELPLWEGEKEGSARE